MKQETIEVIQGTWTGPYSWPGFETEGDVQPVPHLPGLYLLTFEYRNGYMIYAAGLTRRPVPTRFKEHVRKYMNVDFLFIAV